MSVSEFEHWKYSSSLLIYQSPGFQFQSGIIITELDGCVIKSISKSKLYDTYTQHNIEHHDAFIKKLKIDCKDKGIVILSNQCNASKLNIDMIKKKTEAFMKASGIPILAIFALTENQFMKPHTGLWRMLNAYYKKEQSKIYSAVVISDEGGIINNVSKTTKVHRDTDRAFVHNICNSQYVDDITKVSYNTISEYITGRIEKKYIWNNDIIPPEIRTQYDEHIKGVKNKNIMAMIQDIGSKDAYLIMVAGAPRCGKTAVAKSLVKLWRNGEIGRKHAIHRLDLDKYTKSRRVTMACKMLDDRISVIIDGECHTDALREPYIEYLIDKPNIGFLFIDVTVGIEMAKVFNHACVEESKDDQTTLYKSAQYDVYKSTYQRPTEIKTMRYMTFTPTIINKPSIMLFRY